MCFEVQFQFMEYICRLSKVSDKVNVVISYVKWKSLSICSHIHLSNVSVFVLSFLHSPRRYSSGWALASWTICLHSEADCLVSEQFSFYGVRLLVTRPNPNLEDRGIPLRLAPTPWPVRHEWPYQLLRYCRHSSQGLRSTQTPPPR
jgi:hypothetical protein